MSIPLIFPFFLPCGGKREDLIKQIKEIAFPVIVKASGGGGGKGMVICYSEEELMPALESAERQALSWFGNGDLFIEKYLPKARHVEVQLLADHFGKVLHFMKGNVPCKGIFKRWWRRPLPLRLISSCETILLIQLLK